MGRFETSAGRSDSPEASLLFRIAVACSLTCGAGTHTAAQPADETPLGMVAFFMTSGTACPAGWSMPTAAQGRLLLGVTDGAAVGRTVGTPLAAQTAPAHSHTFRTTVSTDSKSIAAIGCCNDQGAANGSRDVPQNPPGTTNGGAPESSDLPFIQLVVCQKD